MYQKTVLANGVRVITEYMPYLRSVTLGAWFDVGSRHEQLDEWGISHFIEHILFKGTQKYSARAIAEIMDQRGGYLNAFTGAEETCYYFTVLDEYFAEACDVLQEILLRPLISAEDLAKEKNVVLEELNMYEDSPEDLVHDLFSHLLWPNDALGRNVLGSVSTIPGFTQAMVRDYMAKHYTADRLVIASAGNIPHAEVVDRFASAFERLPQGVAPKTPASSNQVGGQYFRHKDIEQVHLCVGGCSLSRHDPRRYALSLIDMMVGGGVSSLLFQELREERGIVYNTYSFTSLYAETGAYGVYAAFGPQQWTEVWDVLVAIFRDFPELVTPRMLQRAKDHLKGSLMLSLENTSNRMMRLARGERDEDAITPAEEMARIEQVEYADVLELMQLVYNAHNWSWAGLGPSHLLKEDLLCQIC